MKPIRIIYQVFFFAVFAFLLIAMNLTYMKGYPVRWFLEIDPLVGLATSLATHSLYHGLLWGLALVVVTVLFGRFFCGWICPFGALHYAASSWFGGRNTRERIEANRFRPLYNLKYYLLVALLVMAIGGSLQIGWLDPIAFLTRAFAVFVQPMSQQARSFSFLNVGIGIVAGVAAAVAVMTLLMGKTGRGKGLRALWNALRAGICALAILLIARFSPVEQRVFHWGGFIAALFLLVLAFDLIIPHFWCRALCPLGALLGTISRFSLWQIHRDAKSCKGCRLCVAGCAGACDPDSQLRKSECVLCMNCRVACPEQSITYGLMPPVERERRPSTDLSRRRLIGAAAVGAAWVVGSRIGAQNLRTRERDRIRPPGSEAEREFLKRCIKCGACMKVCPTNVIQPAMFESGLEGLWTPILIYRIGHCERGCTLCGRVCPTGAIRALTHDEKMGTGKWEGQPIRMGTAFFDRGRCLPWSTDTPCVVCQEVCPVSPKAIYTKQTEVVRRDGSKAVIGLPYVDPKLCVGCGICEKECPVHDQRAIRVSSVGETRSKENRMLL